MRMSHIVSALLVTIVLTSSGCGKFNSAEGFYQDALTQYKKGETRSAVIQLKNAAEKDPNFAPARYLLAVVYNENGDFNSAEKEARKALALGFEKNQATIELARALLGQGQGKKMLAEISTSAWQGDTLATISALRGNAHLMLGEVDAAQADFEQARQLSPGHTEASLGLARLAVAKRDLDGAFKLVDQALAKSPHDIASLLFKGDLQRVSAKPEQAVITFNQVLKEQKDHTGAYLSLASIALDGNKLSEARVQVDKARKAQPSNLMAIYMTALVDFREGKYAQARDSVQQVLKSTPNHLPSVVLFAAVSYELGSYEQAEQKLSPVLERMPQNAYVRKLITSTQLKQGKPKRALETIKPLLTPQADVQTLSLAGEAYMGVKDSKKATEYFEKAALAAPESAQIQARLGASRLANGEIEIGIAELEKASRMDPKQAQADGALVMTYMQLRQYDKALAAIDVLEKKQPNTALVHNLRGGAYLGKRDISNARKSFERALAIDPAFTPAAKNLAQLDMQDKKPDAARKRFQNVLSKDKNNVEAMLALADMAVKEKQEKEYLAWVEKAAQADPKALEPKARQIAYLLGKKENQQALALAREAKAANGDSPQAWELLGRAQLVAGEKENAIASFTKLTQLVPEAPRGYLDLGAALATSERWTDARAAYAKALMLNPDYIEARRALIRLELQQNRGGEALKLAEEQTRRQAQSPVGPTLEADVLMTQKLYAQAAKAYERAFNLAKSDQLLIKMHQAMMLAGNEKEADARILAWLKAQPDDVEARVYLANSLFGRKDYKASLGHYEAALKKSPDSALILNNLAVAYDETQDARALATAEQAYKLQPKSAAVQDTLGWILLKQNQTTQALNLLKQASNAAPKSAEIRYHYAAALAKMGDKVKAKAELDAALGGKGSFPSRTAAEALRKQL